MVEHWPADRMFLDWCPWPVRVMHTRGLRYVNVPVGERDTYVRYGIGPVRMRMDTVAMQLVGWLERGVEKLMLVGWHEQTRQVFVEEIE